MSVSIELIEALKACNGGCSDYRAAKIIGVTQPMMSKYRSGDAPLSAEKVLLVCELAGLDPAEWLLKMYKERAKSPAEISVIETLQSRSAA